MNDARGRTFIVAVLMALGLGVTAQAEAIDDQPQPLTLTGDSEKPSLIGHVAILRDPSGGLTITNLAARLCSLAKHDEILITEHVVTANQCLADAEFMGEKNIKGFDRPVAVMRLIEQPA
jgi:hypothetical protein